MRLYHRTNQAKAIREKGFKDTEIHLEHFGVHLSEEHLPWEWSLVDELKGDAVLVVDIPGEEVGPHRASYLGSAYAVPAEVVNRFGPPRIVPRPSFSDLSPADIEAIVGNFLLLLPLIAVLLAFYLGGKTVDQALGADSGWITFGFLAIVFILFAIALPQILEMFEEFLVIFRLLAARSSKTKRYVALLAITAAVYAAAEHPWPAFICLMLLLGPVLAAFQKYKEIQHERYRKILENL